MEVTTFDFGDVSLGAIEDDDNEVAALGVVTFGEKAMLQLDATATGRLDRLRDVEPGFITFVGADGLALSDADYRAIAAIPGLRSVDFDDTTITDDQVAYFCRDGVIALNLATATVTDAAMPAIASIATLEHLFLSRSSITDAGFAALRGHAALEAVHVAATGVSVASAEVVASLPVLTRLEMSAVHDDVLVAAARPGLEFLHLRDGAVTAVGVEALHSSSTLTWLGLMNAELDASACRSFAGLARIETLFLNGSTFDAAALGAALGSSRTLVALNARNTSFADGDVANLAGIPTLQHVDFEGTAVTPEGMALLTQLPKPFELG